MKFRIVGSHLQEIVNEFSPCQRNSTSKRDVQVTGIWHNLLMAKLHSHVLSFPVLKLIKINSKTANKGWDRL